MHIRLAGDLFKTSDFIQCQKLILAVSGGSDSLALLFLVKDYLKTLSFPPEIIAVTVDHQLREESAREAEKVAEICRAHRIKHIIVRWEGEKPKTCIASSARVARYDLLFQEAQKQGATLIMTGHTLNDQVETYQMRYQRFHKSVWGQQQKSRSPEKSYARGNAEGERQKILVDGHGSDVRGGHLSDGIYTGANASGGPQKAVEDIRKEVYSTETAKNIAQKSFLMNEKKYGVIYERGLSCIPREALLRREIRLIRPLLGVKRKTLRAYLCLKGKTWIDDPTNQDLSFERVRVRQSLQPQRLTDIAQKIHEATFKRRQQARIVADLILALDIAVEYGRCFIAKPMSFLQKHPAFPFVLGLFAVLMGGGFYLLPIQKLRTLVQRLCLIFPEKQRLTLGGSVIEYNKNGIALWRESRNMKEAIIAPGKTFLWDGRYQIINHQSNDIKVGAASVEQLKCLLQNKKFQIEHPHFPSLQSLLMISSDKGYDIPELTYQTVFHQNVFIRRIMAPFDWLLSREDADFVNVVEPFFNLKVKR